MPNHPIVKFQNLKREQFLHSNFLYTNYSLDYTLDSLRRLGAEKLEFYGAEPHCCMYDLTYEDMKAFQQKLNDHGLCVEEINPECCTYPNNLASKNPVTRFRSFRYFENAIHMAGVIGASSVVLCPGYAAMDEDLDEAWKLAVDGMSRLADVAKAEGVAVTLEATTPNYTIVTDHKKMKRLLDDCGKDNIKAAVDLLCLAQTSETVQDVYDLCGRDKIGIVHYRDGELLNTGAWANRVPGEGKLDLDASFKAFDDNHYHGYFGSEIRWSTDPALNTPERISEKIQSWLDQHF